VLDSWIAWVALFFLVDRWGSRDRFGSERIGLDWIVSSCGHMNMAKIERGSRTSTVRIKDFLLLLNLILFYAMFRFSVFCWNVSQLDLSGLRIYMYIYLYKSKEGV